MFFAFFRKRVSYTLVFSPFIVRSIFKVVFFDFSKTHLVQKKGLQVHRTTMCASSSSSQKRSSLKVFCSSSARPFPSKMLSGTPVGSENYSWPTLVVTFWEASHISPHNTFLLFLTLYIVSHTPRGFPICEKNKLWLKLCQAHVKVQFGFS